MKRENQNVVSHEIVTYKTKASLILDVHAPRNSHFFCLKCTMLYNYLKVKNEKQ